MKTECGRPCARAAAAGGPGGRAERADGIKNPAMMEQGSCHECPDEVLMTQDSGANKKATIFCGVSISARSESARKRHAYVRRRTERCGAQAASRNEQNMVLRVHQGGPMTSRLNQGAEGSTTSPRQEALLDKLVAVRMDLEPICGVGKERAQVVASLDSIANACDVPVTGISARLDIRPVASGYLSGIRTR